MSQKQWGHGYWKGVKETKQFSEVRQLFKENLYAHFVPVRKFGTNGWETINKELCSLVFMVGEDNQGCSCISGSGDSICGGFLDFWGNEIICGFHYPAIDLDARDPACAEHHPLRVVKK